MHNACKYTLFYRNEFSSGFLKGRIFKYEKRQYDVINIQGSPRKVRRSLRDLQSVCLNFQSSFQSFSNRYSFKIYSGIAHVLQLFPSENLIYSSLFPRAKSYHIVDFPHSTCKMSPLQFRLRFYNMRPMGHITHLKYSSFNILFCSIRDFYFK